MDFLESFERNGFISNLDFFVFEEVCKFIKKYKDQFDIPIISSNLSASTLFHDVKFPYHLMEILNEYELPASAIEIEITETDFEIDNVRVKEKVNSLKKLGFAIAIDDFGVGASSLNRLASLDVDVVKLDKSFLDFNFEQVKGYIVITNIINMAKNIGLKTVCEGIEQTKHVQWLQDIGCDIAQGYYFSKPISEEDFIQLIKENKQYTL